MSAALRAMHPVTQVDTARKTSGKPAERLPGVLAAGSSGDDDSGSPDIAGTLIKVRAMNSRALRFIEDACV